MPDWIGSAITAIASIIVAYFGWKMAASEKESKRNKQLKEEADEKERLMQKEKEDRLNSQIKSIGDRVDELGTSMEELRDEMQVNKTKLDSLITASNYNIRYSRSMSTVISSIGSALTHSGALDVEGTTEIHDAIAKHQEEENEILNQIYKISY